MNKSKKKKTGKIVKITELFRPKEKRKRSKSPQTVQTPEPASSQPEPPSKSTP